MKDKKIKEILEFLPTGMKHVVYQQPAALLLHATELRFRIGQPVQIITPTQRTFIKEHTVTYHELKELFENMCSFSVYAHESDIENGFITLTGGHRAGIVGTAVIKDNKTTVRNISSINIRISREHTNCAYSLYEQLFYEEVENTLLVGAPLSGKTTLIRDLTRLLCNQNQLKVSLIDERDEIANVHYGKAQNDVGQSCDVLTGYPKKLGILTAIRTMSPEVIVCDELGDKEDMHALEFCVNAGAKIIATIHGEFNPKSKQYSRKAVMDFIQSGIFANVVFLKGKGQMGKIDRIVRVNQNDKNSSNRDHHAVLLSNRV